MNLALNLSFIKDFRRERSDVQRFRGGEVRKKELELREGN